MEFYADIPGPTGWSLMILVVLQPLFLDHHEVVFELNVSMTTARNFVTL